MKAELGKAEISVVGRMVRVFYAPSQTFKAVADQRTAADWLVPTIIVAVVSSITAYLTVPIELGTIQSTPSGALEKEGAALIAQTSGAMAASAMTFAALFIFAALYLLVGKGLGGVLDYGQALAIAAYASLTFALKDLITTPLALANETMTVQTGLGLFLSEQAQASFSGALLSSIDPFVVWRVLVVGLGLSILGQIKRRRAVAGVAAIALTFIVLDAFVAHIVLK